MGVIDSSGVFRCVALRRRLIDLFGHLLTSEMLLLLQRERRLHNIASELMTTEEQYVKRLGVLVVVSDVTLRACRNRMTSPSVICRHSLNRQ